MIRWILAVALLSEAVPLGAAVAERDLLGVGDQEETDWSGGVLARGATITAVEPWRFDVGDAMQAGHRWKMKSRRIRVFGAAATQTPGPVSPTALFQPTTIAPRPFSSNGIIVSLTGETEEAQSSYRPRAAYSPFV